MLKQFFCGEILTHLKMPENNVQCRFSGAMSKMIRMSPELSDAYQKITVDLA